MSENTENKTEESSNNRERGGDGNFKKKPYYRKNFVYRKKFCYFKKNKIEGIDYKDITLLSRFLGRSGQITPRRFTGTSAKYQRILSNAVKRARFMALIPYVGVVVNEYYENRQQEKRNYEKRQFDHASNENKMENKPVSSNETE